MSRGFLKPNIEEVCILKSIVRGVFSVNKQTKKARFRGFPLKRAYVCYVNFPASTNLV